jgi:hypothetical protein
MANVFKIIFYNDNKLYEIYAKEVFQSDIFGFIEVEEILFGEQSSLLVDPAEEKLKAEFNNVTRSYIPMHHIVRIDEVPRQATSKIKDAQGSNSTNNVAQFPGSGLLSSKTIIKPKD